MSVNFHALRQLRFIRMDDFHQYHFRIQNQAQFSQMHLLYGYYYYVKSSHYQQYFHEKCGLFDEWIESHLHSF